MSGLSWGASVRGKGCQDYRGKGGLRGASKVLREAPQIQQN